MRRYGFLPICAWPVTVSPSSQWYRDALPPIFAARFSRPRLTLMSFIRMLFAWWHNATFGTLTTIWWSGAAVGTDKFGNRYYQAKKGARRWVLYAGTVEASRVPS